MKFHQLFFRFIVFLLLLFSADAMTGYYLRYLFFHQKSGSSCNLIHTISEGTEQVIITGNSRALHHYDPDILSKKLHMTCFNGGQDGGQSILFSYALTTMILARYTPKIIIVEFDPNSLTQMPEDYERLSVFLPFYKDNLAVRNIIDYRSPMEKWKFASAIYPFNSGIINFLRFSFGKKKLDRQGYAPLYKTIGTGPAADTVTFYPQHVPIDLLKLDAVKALNQLCTSRGVKLFLINSPIFQKPSPDHKNAQLAANVDRITGLYGNQFLDFSTDSVFLMHSSWFVDYFHLNAEGGQYYSKKVAETIKKALTYTNQPVNGKPDTP